MSFKKTLSSQRKISYSFVLVVVLLFFAEVCFLFLSPNFVHLRLLSFFTMFFGVTYSFYAHYSYNIFKRFLFESLLNSFKQRSVNIDVWATQKLLKEDVYTYLKSCFVFVPKSLSGAVLESKSSDKLKDFTLNYKKYSDLNILDKKIEEILKVRGGFDLALGSLALDVFIFFIPYAFLQMGLVQNPILLGLLLYSFRAMTLLSFYAHFNLLKKSGLDLANKIEVFISGDLSEEEGEAFKSRINFDFVLESSSKHLHLLVDKTYKFEIQKLMRSTVSKNTNFSDWLVLNGKILNEAKDSHSKKAILLFPFESGFSRESLKAYIDMFDRVLVVDSSPALTDKETEIHYLDQDQKLKKVKAKENLNRLSGDKGLILRSCKKNKEHTNFFNHLEKELRKKADCYLKYRLKETDEESSTESMFSPQDEDFVVEITDAFSFVSFKTCKIEGALSYNEKSKKAKNFIANSFYRHHFEAKANLLNETLVS